MSDGKKYTDAQIARQMIENVTGREVDVRSITASAAAAQVHATLALVEQQRIANLIALAQLQSEVDEVEGQALALASPALWALTEMKRVEQSAFTAMGGPDEYPAPAADVARALGLS